MIKYLRKVFLSQAIIISEEEEEWHFLKKRKVDGQKKEGNKHEKIK